jgi:hypothetical protein
VNVLPNDPQGSLPGGPQLTGPTLDSVRGLVPSFGDWDRGQLSVCFQGYPQPMEGEGESEATFQYRVRRDAAHLDGLHHEGPGRRRFLREPHAFIFGIPLATVEAGMSPMVVWEGSHLVMQRALSEALAGTPPERWAATDITDAYHAARREVFERCRRVELTTRDGETYLLHRLALHGVAPWASPPSGATERAIVYFRPLLDHVTDWLTAA